MTEYNVGDAVVDAHTEETGTVLSWSTPCTQHPVPQPHQEYQIRLDSGLRVWRCSDDVAPVKI